MDSRGRIGPGGERATRKHAGKAPPFEAALPPLRLNRAVARFTKGKPLRGVGFMSELKLRPTKREAGASRRLFTMSWLKPRPTKILEPFDGSRTRIRPIRDRGASCMGAAELSLNPHPRQRRELARSRLNGDASEVCKGGPGADGTTLSFAFAKQSSHSFRHPLESLTLVGRRR